MNARADSAGTITYGDWLTLNTKLLWCYDRIVHTPRMVIKGSEERSDNRRITGWLVPSGYAIEGYENCAAWLVRSGWAQVQYGDQTFRAGPGQWLIVGKGKRVQYMAAPTHLLSLAFVAEWPDEVPLLKDGLPLVVDAANHPALEREARKLVSMVTLPAETWNTRHADLDYQTYLELSGAWSRWLRLLLDVATSHGVTLSTARKIDSRVAKAVRLLAAHPMDAPLDQAELAARVHLSQSQLIRLFRTHLHTTPREAFEHRRIQLARERLRVPRARAKEVAYGLGFKSLSHFSRWFKKLTGASPREYMQNA